MVLICIVDVYLLPVKQYFAFVFIIMSGTELGKQGLDSVDDVNGVT